MSGNLNLPTWKHLVDGETWCLGTRLGCPGVLSRAGRVEAPCSSPGGVELGLCSSRIVDGAFARGHLAAALRSWSEHWL